MGVKNVKKSPINTLENNILSTINLIKSLKKNTKIILFSTSEVYSPLIFKNKNTIPLKENYDLLIPQQITDRDSYFLSKVINEKICSLSNLKYIIFRPHNIYGPRMGFSHVIPELIKKMKLKKCIVFSPSHSRAFCYIDDAVKQICDMTLNSKIYNEVFNIGNMREEIKIFDLAKIKKKKLNSRAKLLKGPVTSGSPPRRVPNMRKTLKKSKHRNFVNLNQGLKNTINWYIKNEK